MPAFSAERLLILWQEILNSSALLCTSCKLPILMRSWKKKLFTKGRSLL